MILEILSDEQGKPSAARILLCVSLGFTMSIITLDAFFVSIPNAAYSLLGVVFTGLLAWTAGPRIARYLAPQIGALAKGISSAAVRAAPIRPRMLDNHPAFRDDER
jgi:hypothetical protein